MREKGGALSVRVRAELGGRGAQRGAARGDVVVIIDALRASTTIAAALRSGAERVIPVLTVEEASAYLSDPGYRVAGERGGARLPQFHYGNSPTQIWAHRHEIAGLALVLTTSNGTRCIDAAQGGAAALLVGSTVNASAVARTAFRLARRHGRHIALVAAGLDGDPAAEDTFSQRVIARRLSALGALPAAPLPIVKETDSLDVFLGSRSAARLVQLGYAEDVRFCAQVDVWDTVPIHREGSFHLATDE